MGDIVTDNVDCAIRAARQGVFDYALGALRTHRTNHDFAPDLFLDAQGLFQRITVRLVYFKREVSFFNPG